MTSTTDEPTPVDGRFNVVDGMILIAAVAFGFAVPRTFRMLLPPDVYRTYYLPEYLQIHAAAWLLIVSLALLAAVLIRPRSSRRNCFRQPGILAPALVKLTWVYTTIQFTIHWGLDRNRSNSWGPGSFELIFNPVLSLPSRAGLAVLAGWLTLAMLGVMRPSRHWIDRSGRVLGGVWVVWVVWGILGSDRILPLILRLFRLP